MPPRIENKLTDAGAPGWVISAINSLGFPIVVSCALGVALYLSTQSIQAQNERLLTLVLQDRQVMTDALMSATKSVEANTDAIQRLATLVEQIERGRQ